MRSTGAQLHSYRRLPRKFRPAQPFIVVHLCVGIAAGDRRNRQMEALIRIDPEVATAQQVGLEAFEIHKADYMAMPSLANPEARFG